MQLKPSSIQQAARADLDRRARNKGKAFGDNLEEYAFHRKHVQKAKTTNDLIRMAIADPAPGLQSSKRNTVLIYNDEELLKKSLI